MPVYNYVFMIVATSKKHKKGQINAVSSNFDPKRAQGGEYGIIFRIPVPILILFNFS